MKVNLLSNEEKRATDEKITAKTLDGKVSRENLTIDADTDDESPEQQQHVGDECVFAAPFRSGVEGGSRQLPPLDIMCHGLRAARAKENGIKRKS